jgi:enoyl-CoA hydratase/carnithine racemase
MGVRIEHHETAAVVTLDWPEQRNALDLDQLLEVADALTGAVGPETSGVVLTGNGAFCAGGHLRRIADRSTMPTGDRRSNIEENAQGLIRTIVACPVPVVAAIDGPAVGMGFDIALACDSRLIGPDGWCMQGWGRMGVIPGTGGVLLLARLNPSILWRLLEDQPRISGADAERWGLGEAVIDGTAIDAAIRRIQAYAQFSRKALEAYVSLFRAPLRRDLPEHHSSCAQVQAELLTSPEFAKRAAEVMASRS